MLNADCWRVVAASVTGINHIHVQRGCEDAFYPSYDANFAADTFVSAVADGLGSASHAAQGAQCAVKCAVTAMNAKLAGNSQPIPSDSLFDVFQAVQQELILLAEELGVDVNEVACTLQLVVMSAHQLLIGHVGDGLVLGIRSRRIDDDQNPVELLSMMRSKGFGNLTHTVVGKDLQKHIQVMDIRQNAFDQYDGVILMTDGAQTLCFEYQVKQPYQPFFVQLLTWLDANKSTSITELNNQLAGFFTSDDTRQKSGDDITFVVAQRVGLDS